jgi:hypothetical protein
MNIARFSLSQGSHEYHAGVMQCVREAAARTGKPCAILLDTTGPEIRTGKLLGGQVTLQAGQSLVITTDKGAIGTSFFCWFVGLRGFISAFRAACRGAVTLHDGAVPCGVALTLHALLYRYGPKNSCRLRQPPPAGSNRVRDQAGRWFDSLHCHCQVRY